MRPRHARAVGSPAISDRGAERRLADMPDDGGVSARSLEVGA